MGLGAAMAGGNPSAGREEDDFYPTPWECTQALCEAVPMRGKVHEPCCGDGAMVEVLKRNGYDVVASDMNPRNGAGVQRDFFTITRPVGHNIVTNPPFNLAAKMIEHGLTLNPLMMAFLLKATFWHAKTRKELFRRSQPALILPLTWRPDFMNKGAPTMDVMWCVWKRGHVGDPAYRLLDKPQ